MLQALEKKESKISISRIGGSNVISPRGSITRQNCEELETILSNFLKHQKTSVIVDCKSVDFLDSKALETLVRWHETLRGHGGALKITSLNAVCRDILLATRLTNVLRVYQDIPQAVRSEQ